MRVFYGWWIVLAAFLNLFFSVGILFYGFPVFYPSLVDSLGFTRSQLTQGFLIGFVVAALLFGTLVLLVLFPVAQWVTRSNPRELNLLPDGVLGRAATLDPNEARETAGAAPIAVFGIELRRAVCTRNFWLILVACTLTIGAIGAMTQHLILFLKDHGYSQSAASRVSSALLVSRLAGRVIVGYFADRYSAKTVMAVLYLALGLP